MARENRRTTSSTAMNAASGVSPTTFQTRAMPEVRNPVYRYNYHDDFKRTPQPRHALDQSPMARNPEQPHIEARLTSQGDHPRISGPSPTGQPIVPMAYQTPRNVWELFPA